jgi:hypothetical protein
VPCDGTDSESPVVPDTDEFCAAVVPLTVVPQAVATSATAAAARN